MKNALTNSELYAIILKKEVINMENASLIIEMFERIKKLEEQVKILMDERTQKKITTNDIKQYILKKIEESKEDIIVVSGETHKELQLKNSMPMVCNAMYAIMREDDQVLEASPSGFSSTLKIKYKARRNNLV